ncbi:MAG: site-specific integrase [Oscillospiraceae bacterium]|jgi:integrase|nr:site-specific integrase [Oscillospiraceae bacterium]
MAKRRANGEGSIRKRSDGRWEGRYTVGYNPETGKQKFKNVLGKTQTEVKEKLKAAIEESKDLDISRADQFTLSEWLRYWLDNYGKVYLRPSSLTNYTGFLDNQISNDKIGSIKLNKLTTNDLQQFYNRMSESGRVQRKESQNKPKGLSAKSVRNIHCFISHAMNRAIDEKLISENPASRCILPKKEQKEIEILPLTDLQKFFEEAKKSGVFELYFTELATGLRRGELLGLKWTDIDFNANSIYIQRQITRIDGEVKESPLKTKNAYRQIIVPTEIGEILKQKKERENGFSEYVFSSPTGGPISPDSVLKMLHRVLKRAGLEKVRFHALRHTFATLALQNGVDVKTLSGLLGHYSAGFTLDTYGHITPAMKQDAAEKVGSFLSAAL